MKHHLTGLLALALTALVAAPASAQQGPGIQLGLAGGMSKYSGACDGVANCDESGRALRASLGYGFGSGLVLEGLLVDFGKTKASFDGITAQIGVRSIGLGVAFHLPLGGPIDAVLRLGVANNKTKLDASGFGITISESDSATAALFGAGLSWRLSPSAALELAWHKTTAKFEGEKQDVSAFMVGVNLSF